jgi:hypothetical protein
MVRTKKIRATTLITFGAVGIWEARPGIAAAPPTVLRGLWQAAQYPKGLAFSLPQCGQTMGKLYITTLKREP